MRTIKRRDLLAGTAGIVLVSAMSKPVSAQKFPPPASFFQIAVFNGTTNEELVRWTFPFDQWEFGNRQAYDTAWWYALDNGSGIYSGYRTIRLLLQQYGATYIKLNDRNGVQNETSLRLAPLEYTFPYPDLSFEITDPITFIRKDPGNPKVPVAIGGFNPKADDLGDPDVHWYYQGGGVMVGLYGGDPILRLTLSSARDDVMWLSPLG